MNSKNKKIESVVELIEEVQLKMCEYEKKSRDHFGKDTKYYHMLESENYQEEIKKCYESDQMEYYFRGQGSDEFNLEPSAFRKNLSDKEHLIVKNTLSEKFLEFTECETMFEKLTKMQHYIIPSRIMDLSSNLLIALFFACEEKGIMNKDGTTADSAVFMFIAPNEVTVFPDSDKVRLLSNLSRIEKFDYCYRDYFGAIHCIAFENYYKYIYDTLMYDKKNKKYKKTKNIDIREKIVTVNYLLDKNIDKYNFKNLKQNLIFLYGAVLYYGKRAKKQHECIGAIKNTNDKIEKIFNKNVKNTEQIIFPYRNSELVNEIYQLNNMFGCESCDKQSVCNYKLWNLIKEEKPGFENRIETKDLDKWLIVKGAKNNSRIISQSGHFIICPKSTQMSEVANVFSIAAKRFDEGGYEKVQKFSEFSDVQKDLFKDEADYTEKMKATVVKEPIIHKFVIRADKRADILKELDMLGINIATVYPELNNYGTYIKGKYNN